MGSNPIVVTAPYLQNNFKGTIQDCCLHMMCLFLPEVMHFIVALNLLTSSIHGSGDHNGPKIEDIFTKLSPNTTSMA